MMKTAGLLLLAIAVGACAPESPGDGGGGGGGGGADASPGRADARPGTPTEFADAAPEEPCDKMDIVFVIDNSGSMQQEQQNLAANFPGFISVLDGFVASNGNPIDYRVALTSTGVTKDWTEQVPIIGNVPNDQDGDDGAMLQRCSMSRRWLEKADGDVANTFACAAQLGTNGPAQEMPLAALKMALDTRIADGTNAGFHRDDALLAVVILTDENDCSREDNNFSLPFAADLCDDSEPVTTYNSFLDTYTGAPGRWAVAVIAGAGPGSCSSEFGDASEATRLINFANMAGENGVVSSICEGDLSAGLQQALETFDTACQTLPPID